MYFTLYAVKRALFATAKGALTMAKEILGTEAAPNFIAALETTVAPYTTAIPDITAIPETNPDTMAIPETIAASDTNPDTTAASDTNPDTTAAPDTTPDLMAASDTTPDLSAASDTTPDLSAASDTHATSVSKDEDEDEFDNLVKEIEVDVHVDEEFEELFKNYERDEYYTDIVGLYFSQPSHPVLKVGNRRLVTPGAGDSLRDTKSIYEILADRKEWRVSHPGKIQPSFKHEISLYVKEYDFSFSKPEIKL